MVMVMVMKGWKGFRGSGVDEGFQDSGDRICQIIELHQVMDLLLWRIPYYYIIIIALKDLSPGRNICFIHHH